MTQTSRPLFSRLLSRLTGLVTASALALGSLGLTVAPARADDAQDLRRFLGTAAGLVILGAVLSDIAEDEQKKAKRDRDRARPQPRPKAALPLTCRIPVQRGDTRFAYGQRCMERHYEQAHRLPDRCEIRLGRHGQGRRAYSGACLRREGFPGPRG